MKPVKKEVRRILCGLYNDDGTVIRAAEKFLSADSRRMNSAVLRLRLLGVRSVRRSFELSEKHPSEICADVMMGVGRVVELQSAPEEVAMLHESLVRYPYVITARLEKKTVFLTYYSARWLFSALRGLKILKALGAGMQSGREQPAGKTGSIKNYKKN